LLTEQVERLQIGLYSLIPSAFIRSFSFNPLYQCGQQQLQDEEDLRLQLQLQRCEAAKSVTARVHGEKCRQNK